MFNQDKLVYAKNPEALAVHARTVHQAVLAKLDTMEAGTVTFKRVRNLSRSDLEELEDLTELMTVGENPLASYLLADPIKLVLVNAGILQAQA